MSRPRLAPLAGTLLILAGLALAYRAYTTPTETAVIVEWSTASELDTASFNLYRSNRPDGPFTRVNEHLIPGSPDPLTGGSYTFTDTQVVAGHTYFYQLEDVETDGATTRHGPIEIKAEDSDNLKWLAALASIGIAVLGLAVLILAQHRNTVSPA